MPATMDPEPYAPVGADLGRSSSAGSDFDERAEFPSVLLENPAPEQADGATIRRPFSGAQAASGTLKPAPLAVTWRRGVDWSNAVCRLRQARFPNVTRATTACEPGGAELPFTHRGLCLALNQIGTGRLVLIDPAARPH